ARAGLALAKTKASAKVGTWQGQVGPNCYAPGSVAERFRPNLSRSFRSPAAGVGAVQRDQRLLRRANIRALRLAIAVEVVSRNAFPATSSAGLETLAYGIAGEVRREAKGGMAIGWPLCNLASAVVRHRPVAFCR